MAVVLRPARYRYRTSAWLWTRSQPSPDRLKAPENPIRGKTSKQAPSDLDATRVLPRLSGPQARAGPSQANLPAIRRSRTGRWRWRMQPEHPSGGSPFCGHRQSRQHHHKPQHQSDDHWSAEHAQNDPASYPQQRFSLPVSRGFQQHQGKRKPTENSDHHIKGKDHSGQIRKNQKHDGIADKTRIRTGRPHRWQSRAAPVRCLVG